MEDSYKGANIVMAEMFRSFAANIDTQRNTFRSVIANMDAELERYMLEYKAAQTVLREGATGGPSQKPRRL